MTSQREFDLIVWGATGFTGRLIAEYLLKKYRKDKAFNWAIAGRSLDKLKTVHADMGAPESLSLLVANSDDVDSLKTLASSSKVIISSVGPYQLYGTKLLQACVESGTDYVDLCGEPNWMRQMIDAHSDAAKASGARILFSCGFDSLPSEMGAWYCQHLALKRYSKAFPIVNARLTLYRGSISGGTVAAGAATRAAMAEDEELQAQMMNPFMLTPGFQGAEQPLGMEPEVDPDLGEVEPYFLAMINTKNVHRAHMLLDHIWGKDFTYDEMLLTSPDASGNFSQVTADPSKLPKPGDGPGLEVRESGEYEMVFIGRGLEEESIAVSYKGKGDPGYLSTSRMISETALCLLERSDVEGGIWTPAAALQESLFKRLQDNAEITIQEVDLN